MLSLVLVRVDAFGTERFISTDIAQSIPHCFFNSGGFEAEAELQRNNQYQNCPLI